MSVIPAGAAAIVPNVAGMEVGFNRIITVPAGVTATLAGRGMIVQTVQAAIVPMMIPPQRQRPMNLRKRLQLPTGMPNVIIMEHGAGHGVTVLPVGVAAIAL